MRVHSLVAALSLAVVSLQTARAAVVVEFLANRGTISADGVSLGAFTGTTEIFAFRGLVYSGNAGMTWYFDDAAIPGTLEQAVTLSSLELGELPMEATAPIGGSYYVLNPGSGPDTTPTTVAPFFFTDDPYASSTVTFTPTGTGDTKFTATNTGNIAGGGTYSLQVSGILWGPNSATPYEATNTYALRLFNVDSSVYGAPNLIVSGKGTGYWAVPEPHTWVLLALGFIPLWIARARKSGLRSSAC